MLSVDAKIFVETYFLAWEDNERASTLAMSRWFEHLTQQNIVVILLGKN